MLMLPFVLMLANVLRELPISSVAVLPLIGARLLLVCRVSCERPLLLLMVRVTGLPVGFS
jgi:hypothetical protein